MILLSLQTIASFLSCSLKFLCYYVVLPIGSDVCEASSTSVHSRYWSGFFQPTTLIQRWQLFGSTLLSSKSSGSVASLSDYSLVVEWAGRPVKVGQKVHILVEVLRSSTTPELCLFPECPVSFARLARRRHNVRKY